MKKFYIKFRIILSILYDVFRSEIVLKDKEVPMPKDITADEEKQLIEELEKLTKERRTRRLGLSPDPNEIPLSQMSEVPAEKIIQAAEMMGENNPNSFTMLLLTAEVYRSMNVEPVFLINQDQTAIRVAAREIWENPKRVN